MATVSIFPVTSINTTNSFQRCASFCLKMFTRVRNRDCFPVLATEGVILKPLPREGNESIGPDWQKGLPVYRRLHGYHTLASVRRYALFEPFEGLTPKDSLDFSLAATYAHSFDKFPDKIDFVLQKETLGYDTWRRLRNTRDLKLQRDTISAAAVDVFKKFGGGKFGKQFVKYNEFHPLHVGGIKDRKHPSNVKLMNSSHHSPQTNAGYTRQDSDGNAYVY